MSEEHCNEPRFIGYDKVHKEAYKDWTNKDSGSIFSGLDQKDLFLFAMAVGYNRNKHSEVKNKVSDIPVSALTESQKWGILSPAIFNNKDLSVLTDEKKIYLLAEEYAEEGIKIIKSHIDKEGINYPKFLEVELKKILKK